ncbi:MAG: hypothetical protein JWR39_1737 [Devosia sp.]|jgi:hypothetical protein|nr:hypothetical protein [Devosia sp.]
MEGSILQHHVYRLVPVAGPNDPNWGRAVPQGEVVVRALSSGDARVVASHGEAAAITLREPLATTQVEASALRDPKLYHVVQDTSGRYSAEGPRAVLQAMFQVPENYVISSD